MATLMTVSVGGAAMGGVAAGPDGGATISDRTDVYIRDIGSDVGYEPHGPLLTSYFNSPDIRICPTAIDCGSHNNPVVGSDSSVFVDLRRDGPYGTGLSFGRLYVYYTTAGGGADWDSDWTEIGYKDLAIGPGVTTTSVLWEDVPSLGHFCLLVRWVSSTDPMHSEGIATSINVQYNNNIAWKNANTIFPGQSGGISVRPFALGNALAVQANFDLAFRAVGEPIPGRKLVADLGPELFERWQRAGAKGEGIRVIGRNQVEIVDTKQAQIIGLPVDPDVRSVISLNFSFGTTLQKAYSLQVVQIGPLRRVGERYEVGGVDYTISPGRG